MSTTPESDLDLDLHFLPAWARQSPDVNRYANYQGDEGGRGRGGWGRRDRGPDRGGRPPHPGGGREGRGGPGRGERPPGPRREGSGFDRQGRGPRRAFPGGRGRPEPVREAPEPLPEVGVTLTPEALGVESLARQIKYSGRAYPMFEIASLILRKPERYLVTFSVLRKPDGQVAQSLWVCSVDDTLWLSQEDAVNHVLRRHFDLFYQTEKTPTEPPKGTYTFVAQCGLSGIILGPPNFHDYQSKLLKLHASRFSRMSFEAYKARIRIVRDEAIVKKWVEDQSWRTEYSVLNVPETLRLGSREEAEKHFREVHAGNLIRETETWTTTGATAQKLPSPVLRQLVRSTWEDQQRFPLKVVNVLSQQFASHGLQFFKVNKTITHVAVARPHYLDLDSSPVSEGIRRIVDYITAHPGCNRRRLTEALVPTPPPPAAPPPAAPAPPTAAPATGEGVAAPAEAPPAAPPPPPAPPELTPEQTALIADLHWLIHQGHVIEFANGRLEAARKPKPRPVKPAEPASAEAAPASAVVETAAPVEIEISPATATPAPPEETAPPAEATVPQEPPADTAAATAPVPEGLPLEPAVPTAAPASPEPPTEPERAPENLG